MKNRFDVNGLSSKQLDVKKTPNLHDKINEVCGDAARNGIQNGQDRTNDQEERVAKRLLDHQGRKDTVEAKPELRSEVRTAERRVTNGNGWMPKRDKNQWGEPKAAKFRR